MTLTDVPRCAITFDIDWAPDFVLLDVLAQLVRHQVKATWFVTHATPVLDAISAYPALFELGVHPNFGDGSSHGATPEAVIRHCTAIVPGARAMRTHSLVQSSPILATVLASSAIRIDVSMFLPRATWLRPVVHRFTEDTLMRLPYSWADDYEMVQPDPQWNLVPLPATDTATTILDFHPIHVALDDPSPAAYTALKRRVPRLTELSRSDLESSRACGGGGGGSGTTLAALITHLARTGGSRTVSELAAESAGT